MNKNSVTANPRLFKSKRIARRTTPVCTVSPGKVWRSCGNPPRNFRRQSGQHLQWSMRAAQKSTSRARPRARQLGASLQTRPDTAQAQQWAPPTQIDVSSGTTAAETVGYQACQSMGAQDTWFDIEDLLLRLAARCPVQTNQQEDHLELTFLGFNAATRGGRLSDVAVQVIDLNTYAWQSDGTDGKGSQGNFISDLELQGEDLCLRFKTLARIKRWEEGESIAWQVKTFLNRLQALRSPINHTVL